MFKFMKFEIKRNLKKSQVKILIGLLLICELVMLVVLNNKAQIEDVFSLSQGSMEVSALTRFNLPDSKRKYIEKQIESVNNKGKFFEYYKENKQWKKMYITGMEVYCYNVDMRTSIPIKSQSTFDYTNHEKELKQIQKKYKLTRVPPNPKECTWFQPVGTAGYEMIPTYQQGARYFERLYRNELSPLCYSSVDSATVLIQLSRNVLFLGIPILIVLLFFNVRKNYHDDGLDKSLMVIPGLKNKFYIYKFTSDFILILGVVFVPILIFSIILGIKSGFQNFKYPILANVDGITGFSFSRIKDFVNGTQHCISKNAMYNVGLTYYSTEMARNPYLDYTTLGIVIILTVVMLILLIGVYYQFTFMVSYLIKNAYIGLFISLFVIVGLYFLSPLGSLNMINIINPLTYRDPTMIITGTSSFPYSIGMIVLLIYNVLLFVLNRKVFNENYDYGKKTMVINKLIIDSAILLFVYVIVLFLFQYQSIYLYFLENRKTISLNCLLGKNIWQKYRDFIIVNLFVYLVLLLWMVLVVKNISTIGLYLWIFTILIDFMIALIFRTYFERKKVLLSLKGDLE